MRGAPSCLGSAGAGPGLALPVAFSLVPGVSLRPPTGGCAGRPPALARPTCPSVCDLNRALPLPTVGCPPVPGHAWAESARKPAHCGPNGTKAGAVLRATVLPPSTPPEACPCQPVSPPRAQTPHLRPGSLLCDQVPFLSSHSSVHSESGLTCGRCGDLALPHHRLLEGCGRKGWLLAPVSRYAPGPGDAVQLPASSRGQSPGTGLHLLHLPARSCTSQQHLGDAQ